MLIGETDCLLEEKKLFVEQDNKIRFGSVRFDKYFGEASTMTFEAGQSSIEGPVFQTGIGRVQNIDSTRPFYRVGYSNRHWNVIAHHSTRDGNQANLNKALFINFELISDTRRTGAEVQGHWDFRGGRGRIVVGAAHTDEKVDTTNPATGRQTVVYEPISADRQAIFSQLDWKVNEHFKLVFAGRVDESTLHDTQFSPKAAAVYSINKNHSMRFTFNEAFQVANYSEFFLHARLAPFPIGGFVTAACSSPALPMPVDCGISEQFIPILAVGNDDLELEETSAWEVGYTGLLASRVFVTVDYYNSDNKNFITDLIKQVGTDLGNVDGCVDSGFNPVTDPTRCPINADYLPWVSTPEAESTFLFGTLTVAQALRNAVDASVGGSTLGFRLAQDLDGSTVVVGRTYTNVGQVETQGVDFGLQYFLNDAWRLQTSYSWFDFEIFDPSIEDILLPNSPKHKASMAVAFTKKRWSAGIGGRWVQGFRWSAGVFQGDVDDYYTIDLNANVELNRVVRIGLNVANLDDNLHRQTFGGDLLSRRALVNMSFHW
jgi:outer membrane receptor protein involved in Fe transport